MTFALELFREEIKQSVCKLVHNVNGTAVCVNDYIVAVEKIFMYHIRRVSPLSLLLAAAIAANCFRQNFRDRRKACP